MIERLSRLDSQAEGALRVVAFYDTLMRRRVDLPALARSSAALAECVVGIRLHGTGRTIRTAPDGREAPVAEAPVAETPVAAVAAAEPAPTRASAISPAASCALPIMLDEEEIGTVWLERLGPDNPLDELLLDRLAIAVAGVVERYGPASTTMADPALVELVISSDTDTATRARALRLLGFAADLPVRAVAVRSTLPLDRVGARICSARPVKAAPLSDVGVILATMVDATNFPAGVFAGVGAATDDPARSWQQARTALRFTTEREPILHHANLGAWALLAQVPRDVARDNDDVNAIARMAANSDDMETLDAYCATGSLRRSAEILHRHHSSVARRIEQIGKALDIDLTEPAGIVRANIALTSWRLLDD